MGVPLVHSDGEVCQALQVRVSGDVVGVRVGDDDALHLKVDRLVQQTLYLGRGVDEVRLLGRWVGDYVAVVVVGAHAGDLEDEATGVVYEGHGAFPPMGLAASVRGVRVGI